MRRIPSLARAAALFALAFLGSCASFSPDGGLIAVNDITTAALGTNATAVRTPEDAEIAGHRVKALLRLPLTADRAVQVALLSNRELQAAFNALRLSEAAAIQASLPPNPTFSLERIAGAGALEIEGRVAGSVLQLMALPVRADIAAQRFRQAQFQAAFDTLRIAGEARRAFYRAVAASALAAALAQARQTGETAAELARRLGETGAMNKLDQARNQSFYAEMVAQLGTARLRAALERERLVRALGLWGNDLEFKLPSQLPPIPPRARALVQIETDAVRRRVDLQMARIEADLLAKSYGLTNATRFISLLDVAGIAKEQREGGEVRRERGFEVEVQIPLFDFGEVKLRQAEENYLQAVNKLTAKAVIVRSEAREAYQAYRASFDIARHYRREVLPLRKIISDETLLRYNAMQIDVFALLTEARQRITATNAAIEAERDFWLAETNLGAAVLGGAGAASPEATASTPAAESPGAH
jgi:outer membrane protein TolC